MRPKSLHFIYSLACLSFLAIIFIPKFPQPSSNSPSSSSAMADARSAFPETFYISHGSPTLSIDDSLPARQFLKSFRRTVLPEKPAAILIVSGHWETSDPTVNAVAGPSETIYDFYGFPDRMYKLKYPAPGSPDLADRVKHLLQSAGFGRVKVDGKRGLDHGAWVPLMLMYPDADIPVCQLSIQTHKDAEHHYKLGKALRSLKDDGVLIVGSGAATHNLRKMNLAAGESAEGWAYEFDNWIKEALAEGRYEDVNDFKTKAPYARVAHPSPDHFYPLHVAMGAAGENTRGELIHSSWSYGTVSYSSYKFAEKA